MAYALPQQHDPTDVMGRRILAYVIDAVLIFGVTIAILAATRDQTFTGAPANACSTLKDVQGFSGGCLQIGSRVYTWKGSGLVTGYLLGVAAGLVNIVVLQGLIGASIGKLIMGLRVVNADGRPCGLGRAFLRWLLLIVDGLCGILGLIVALVTHPHRRVGDMVASTYVVALADVGRPLQVPGAVAPQYQYAYGPPPGAQGAPGWAPPGAVPPPAPGWGTTPPPAAGWGTPPPPEQQPGWGAPPPAATWGAPPPPPDAPYSGPPPLQPDATRPPPWSAPAAPPAPPAPPAPSGPPPPPRDYSGWGTPESPWSAPTAPTPEPPAAPAPPAPTPEAPAAPAPTPPPPAPPSQPAEEPAPTAAEGESWWSKAFNEDDDDKK